jgi:PKHD-type hydroxylase
MKGEWCYFKSYLNPELCNKIISDVEPLPWQDGLIGSGESSEVLDDGYRRSKIKFIYANDWRFEYIFDMFWKTAISANNDFFMFNISRLNFVQFAEYDASYEGEYKDHHDVFWMNGDDYYHRKLSCVIQLTDPNKYDGGDLNLVEATHKPLVEDIRAQGTITYFPSFLRHQVTPVTRGTRYSLTAWFEGRKWA